MNRMEAVMRETPDIAAFSRRTGTELGLFATQPNKGDILVRLKPRNQREAAEDVINRLRDKLTKAVPQVEIEFIELLQDMIGDLEGAPTPIEVKIFGDDADRLADLGEDVEKALEGVKGVVDIVGVQRGSPETIWDVDPVATGRLGLTVTCPIGRFLCACAIRMRIVWIRAGWRRRPCAARKDERSRSGASPTHRPPAAKSCCSARTCARWRSSRRASRTATSGAPSRRFSRSSAS
ncbi:MAG: hypothetical protein DMF85_00715 [Acidobacteria bacterium]|nr:MAG: hypothetical protein DMF85_00715 [Acidobacteriota bacterium]